MSAKEIADRADMIVAGYAFTVREGYVEVVDLSAPQNVLTIQNDVITESLMDDEEEAIVLKYYIKNKDLLEEARA